MSHPQIDIPVGGSNPAMDAAQVQQQQLQMSQQQQQPGWNGLTIREILEKVDLFNITVDETGDVKKEGDKLVTNKGVSKPKVRTDIYLPSLMINNVQTRAYNHITYDDVRSIGTKSTIIW